MSGAELRYTGLDVHIMKGKTMSDNDKQRGKGFIDEAKGKAKQAWGAVSDDESTEAEGKWDETKGKGRQDFADAKETTEEKLGQKKKDQ